MKILKAYKLFEKQLNLFGEEETFPKKDAARKFIKGFKKEAPKELHKFAGKPKGDTYKEYHQFSEVINKWFDPDSPDFRDVFDDMIKGDDTSYEDHYSDKILEAYIKNIYPELWHVAYFINNNMVELEHIIVTNKMKHPFKYEELFGDLDKDEDRTLSDYIDENYENSFNDIEEYLEDADTGKFYEVLESDPKYLFGWIVDDQHFWNLEQTLGQMRFEDEIEIYRSVVIQNTKEELESQIKRWTGVGISWSYEEEGAKPHSQGSGIEIILHGKAKINEIDWRTTLYKSIYPLSDEMEIKMKSGGEVEIIGFELASGWNSPKRKRARDILDQYPDMSYQNRILFQRAADEEDYVHFDEPIIVNA